MAHPVLYPDKDPQEKYEWEGGCEDPRVVEDENGMYMMTYTAYHGDKARLWSLRLLIFKVGRSMTMRSRKRAKNIRATGLNQVLWYPDTSLTER